MNIVINIRVNVDHAVISIRFYLIRIRSYAAL